MNITWTGNAGDNLFYTAGNWIPAQVPGASDDVTIAAAATITVNGNATVNSLSIGAQTVLDVYQGFSILGTATSTDPSGTSTIDGTVNVNNQESLSIAGSIAGTGTIALNSLNQPTDLIVSGTQATTLAGGGSIELSDNGANRIYGATSATVLDNVSDTISGAGQLGVSQLTLINSGVIDATGTNALVLDTTAATNSGTLEATGEAGLVIESLIANKGGTVAAKGGNVFLDGGTIAGGTLQSSDGAAIVVQGEEAGTLDGSASAIANTGSVLVENQGTVDLLGSIDNSGTIALQSTNQNTDLVIDSSKVTLSGGGSVTLSDNAANYILGAAGTDTLDNVDNTISGAGQLGDGRLTLVNASLIDATGSNALVLDTTTATNTGTLEATGAGVLLIESGIANKGGTVAANGGYVFLNGGTIAGGTLQSSGGAAIEVLGEDVGTLDGLASAIANTGSVLVENQGTLDLLGSIDNTGAIGLQSTNQNTDLVINSSTVTLSGGGSVTLSDNAGNRIYGAAGADTLDNVDNTISGAGQLGDGQLTLINSSVIDATGSNALVLDTTALTNSGMLEASGTGGLVIESVIGNTGGIVAANGGNVYLDGGKITGGTLQSSGGAAIEVTGDNTGALDGSASAIVNAGSIITENQGTLDLLGSIDNSGTIALQSTNQNTDLVIDSSKVTLSGGGSVTLSDNAGNRIYGASGSNTLDNVDNTISGAGQLGDGQLTLINSSVIDATGSNALVLDTTALTNSGMLEASGTGGLVIESVIGNTGGIVAANGGNVYLDGGKITGGTLQSSGGAAIEVTGDNTGALDGSASAIVNAGSIITENQGTLDLLGSIDNSGTIALQSTNQNTDLVIDSSKVTLSGGGSVTLTDNAGNRIYGASGSNTLDNVDNTISGAGQLGAGQLTLINSGIIDASGNNSMVIDVGGSYTGTNTSTGVLEATGAGSLILQDGTYSNAGTLFADHGSVTMESTAELTNDSSGILQGGTYEATGGVITLAGASIRVDGATIELSGAGSVLQTTNGASLDATLAEVGGSGTLELLADRSFSARLDGGSLVNAGSIILGGGTLTAALNNSGTVSGYGELTGSLSNTSLITATGGTLTIAEAASGNFAIASSGVLGLTAAGTGGTVSFLGSGAELELSAPGSFSDTLGSLGNGDVIAVLGDVTSATIQGTSDLSFVEGGNTFEYQLVGAAAGLGATLHTDGAYTDIVVQAACYRRGTRILTPQGYQTIETLRIGDAIATLTGNTVPIKWIARRSYSACAARDNLEVLPILIGAAALGDGWPLRDLWVSPGHAMYLEGMLISARDLINGYSITQERSVDELTYYHLEFDEHTAIYAEGAAAESYVDDDNREMFDNWLEFHELYPHEVRTPAAYCAPRVEDGWALERIRQQLSGAVPGRKSGYTVSP